MSAVPEVSDSSKVHAALVELLASQKVLKLATAGGPTSPWITGTYFAEDDPFKLRLTLEKTGRGMANVAASAKVALAVDKNDPFTTFAQAEGRARVLSGPPAEEALAALRRKVPEIEPLLKGAINVLEIDVQAWFVTSFPNGWFPARRLLP